MIMVFATEVGCSVKGSTSHCIYWQQLMNELVDSKVLIPVLLPTIKLPVFLRVFWRIHSHSHTQVLRDSQGLQVPNKDVPSCHIFESPKTPGKLSLPAGADVPKLNKFLLERAPLCSCASSMQAFLLKCANTTTATNERGLYFAPETAFSTQLSETFMTQCLVLDFAPRTCSYNPSRNVQIHPTQWSNDILPIINGY